MNDSGCSGDSLLIVYVAGARFAVTMYPSTGAPMAWVSVSLTVIYERKNTSQYRCTAFFSGKGLVSGEERWVGVAGMAYLAGL